ncbi:MAG: YiiD C-terminal domain-containing protein, partial [Chthoniobacterales bacterium]|nr:YiiD C-terminal domain-containing protein [Chthoniobacterales bacterium]
RPVRETIRAICSMPAAGDLAALKSKLRSEGTARLQLSVRVEENGVEAAQFSATFVGIAQSPE